MHPYRLELVYVQHSGHLGAMAIHLLVVLKLHFVFLLKHLLIKTYMYIQSNLIMYKTKQNTCHYSSTISTKAKDGVCRDAFCVNDVLYCPHY